MAFKKKTWTDRMVEYAGRRKLTNISTKQAIVYDVERAEGTVSKEGDAFSSQNMNDFEQRVEDGFAGVQQDINEINSDLAGYKFGKTIDGQPGYIAPGGADTVIPFNRVINITNEVMGNRFTITLGFHPDLLYIEFGSKYEVKRLYSIYSGAVDSVTVNDDGFTCSFNAGGMDTPCRYRAVKFT